MGKKKGKKQYKPVEYNGILDISRSGVGFVEVENQEQDILVKPQDFGKAFNGDKVKVRIISHKSNGRKQGEVIEVLERRNTLFLGRISINGKVAFFEPDNNSMPDFYLPANSVAGVENGDRAQVKFIKWGDKDRKPEGAVVTVIKGKNDGDLAMKEILLENNFPLTFPDNVLRAAEKLDGKISNEELQKRKDFRDVLTFTIDPVDAKDFDDALSFKKLNNGNFEIGVHIADVSYFVTEGSEIDQEAYQRATSAYLPDRVNPMLPEKLSNFLCSLRPNEDKYTFSAVFEISPTGTVKGSWLGRTVIHSNHRFAYEEVQRTIETKQGLHAEVILTLNNIAKKLRVERFKNGAINFSSQEIRFKLDDTGKPIGIIIKESTDATKLIEEFMLLANRTVAEYVSKIKIGKEVVPFPYRVHDSPDEEKLILFVAFAKKFGYKFNLRDEKTIADSFNKLLKDVEGKPEARVLEQIAIRSMAKAFYTTDNIGHYGLGFQYYAHFTSPIRRYPDVMVHRVLQQCLNKKIRPEKDMEMKCVHCSERERAAMEAERSGSKYKQVEYMQQFLGEVFQGIITGVAHFGFWVETIEQKCEGLVSLSDLSDYDDFRYDPENYALVGLRTGKFFRMGDEVKIKVVAADLDKRQLDYQWITEIKEKPAGKKKK